MDGLSSLRAAHDALARHDWQAAYDAFGAADLGTDRRPEDDEAMSEAAFWSGHPVEALAGYQTAYTGYVNGGQPGEAASVALQLAVLHFARGDESVAAGWFGRAQRLVAELPECGAHAKLAWIEAMMLGLTDRGLSLERAQEAETIATRVGEPDLIALSIAQQGYMRAHSGDVSGGMALLDEALATALGGELGPWATAEIFCEMVVSCLEVADYERATEWLETAERAGEDMVCFPGCCRVHHATVLRHRGEWTEAHREAHQARSECAGVERFHEGMALTEMGELYRYKGDLGLAERAFSDAYEKGWIPQPGLALVHFAKDDVDGAAQMIQRSVASSHDEPATLIRLLPAQAEIAIAAGDEELAATAAARLAEIASTLGTSATANAANASVAGLLSQQRGDLRGAANEFDTAVRGWQQARNPYEVSQARMRLATVLETLGDHSSAHLELAAARATFERLGAGPEAREAARRLGDNEPTIAARAFMFTDIVNSTALLTSIGDAAWHGVRQWHDQTIATIVGEHQGRIVKDTGDGFFAAFDDVNDAVHCAIAIQRALDDHRRTTGFAPSVRIGLHVGTAVTIDADFAGRDVVVAARIGSLAGAEQILVSGAVIDQVGASVVTRERTVTSLKGIPEPVEVATLDWR